MRKRATRPVSADLKFHTGALVPIRIQSGWEGRGQKERDGGKGEKYPRMLMTSAMERGGVGTHLREEGLRPGRGATSQSTLTLLISTTDVNPHPVFLNPRPLSSSSQTDSRSPKSWSHPQIKGTLSKSILGGSCNDGSPEGRRLLTMGPGGQSTWHR